MRIPGFSMSFDSLKIVSLHPQIIRMFLGEKMKIRLKTEGENSNL